MFHRLPAVLFDLDGTLVDSSDDLAAALNQVLEQDSLPAASLAEVRRMVGDGAPVLIERAYGRHGRTPGAGVLERFRQHYGEHCLDRTRPYPGIRSLLERLAPERQLAVVTNKPTGFARQIVAGLDLADLLPTVIGPELARRRKPAPEHLQAALSELGRAPREAVMVGDSTHDVVAGRRAGTATVAVLWGYRPREDLAACGPDEIVASMAELAELLLGAKS